jgi:hypothetical protein
VYRYKRKSGYHKKNGHRQPYTKVWENQCLILVLWFKMDGVVWLKS